MSKHLPQLVDPRRAVALGSVFEGEARLSELERLSPLLEDSRGSVTYRLGFGTDAWGHSVMTGAVNAILTLRCQRCNGRLSLPVESRWVLALVDGIDEMASLPDAYDPLLVQDQLLQPLDWIEDELILAVPPIPRHPEGTCAVSHPEYLYWYPTGGDDGGAKTSEEPRRPNPFAELSQFKRSH